MVAKCHFRKYIMMVSFIDDETQLAVHATALPQVAIKLHPVCMWLYRVHRTQQVETYKGILQRKTTTAVICLRYIIIS